MELLLIALAVPLNKSANARAILMAIVIPTSIIGTYFGGWWAARITKQSFLLHGALVGAVAAVIYAALTWRLVSPRPT